MADARPLDDLLRQTASLAESELGLPLGDLIEQSYESLRRIAAAKMGGRAPAGMTMTPTAVVNEAVTRILVHGSEGVPASPDAFMAYAAVAVHRVILDGARRRRRHPGHWAGAPGAAQAPASPVPDDAVERLIDALDELAATDGRKASVLTMACWEGKDQAQIAAALGVSLRTVQSDLTLARAWLRQKLG